MGRLRKTIVCVLAIGGLGITLSTLAAAEDASKPLETVDDLNRKQRLALFTAQQERDKQDFVKAAEAVAEFLGKNPKDDHYLLRFALASDLDRAEQPESALEQYKRCVALEPRFGQGWLNLGELAYNLEHYELAARALEEGFELHPDKPPHILYFSAAAHLMSESPERAAAQLERLVSGRHGEPKLEWSRALVSACLELKDQERGERALSELLRWHGGEADAWQLAFQFYAAMNDYRNAAVALTITGYLRPLTRTEEIQLGDLYTVIEIPSEASDHYETAFSDSAVPSEVERLSSAYLAAHEIDRALSAIEHALERSPTPRLYSLLGDLYYMERRYEDSYRAFERCVQIDSSQARSYLMMAYCAIELERYTGALAHLEQAAAFPEYEARATDLIKPIQTMLD